MATALARETVPALITELHEHIVRITGKPLDSKVQRLTAKIELDSMYRPLEIREDWLAYGLTGMERRVMEILTRRSGVLSVEALANALYGSDPNSDRCDRIVDVYIHKIRKKFVTHNAPVWVETVWGSGYRYVTKPARECVGELKGATIAKLAQKRKSHAQEA